MRVEILGRLERRRHRSQDDKGVDRRGDIGARSEGNGGCAQRPVALIACLMGHLRANEPATWNYPMLVR